ncbi:MAG: UDP-N-acetylglucosamine 2-epimerase (non-hydrolyzing) [Tannerella sp.]|jgi:UDP-GlcNAc3NAcA epimerase|nr:UDP-N-acetylglucosamine 2-epimerase (non-hydrolyzing) [Tannerella sp.]
MKIVTIIGARPQFIKAAAVSRAIRLHNRTGKRKIDEKIIHTGQHYDRNMSRIFFDELQIPPPFRQLQCSHGSHAKMTADMLVETESVLIGEQPDYVLVYGDTNSTLAGALTAAKLQIPVIHIEAGLRSFNRQMPEEINRIVTDHVSAWLFCPTLAAVRNLKRENITQNVFHTGDVMYDAACMFGRMAEEKSAILSSLQLTAKQFYLCTVHRAENTGSRQRLTGILEALAGIAANGFPVILPLHPRTKTYMEQYNLYPLIEKNRQIKLIEPVNYLDMIMLEKQAAAILTDSGGMQKEAYFHRTPCITLREETEWMETVQAGWNQLAGCRRDEIIERLHTPVHKSDIGEYGDGHAAEKIIELLIG